MTQTSARVAIDKTLSEEQWQQTVIEYATLRGWATYHTRDSRRSNAGYPDLTMVRRTRLVFAELKSETGKPPGAAQVRWLRALEEAGAECYVWRPRDWLTVEKILA